MTAGIDPELLQAYADVVLRCGVNVEQGQKVLLMGAVEHQRPAGRAGGAGVRPRSLRRLRPLLRRPHRPRPARRRPRRRAGRPARALVRADDRRRHRGALGAREDLRRLERRSLLGGAGEARQLAAGGPVGADPALRQRRHQLVRVRLPHSRLGRARLRGARRRALVARPELHGETRRARSRRGLGAAAREAGAARGAAERGRLQRPALRRRQDRPHRHAATRSVPGSRPGRPPRGAGPTSATCPPKRSSPRPTSGV